MSEEELITLLRNKDKRAYEYVHREYFPEICPLILGNSGTMEEAKEVFNDAILVLAMKAGEKDMIFTSKVKTYLYSIVKYKWWDRLKKKKAKKKLQVTSLESLSIELEEATDATALIESLEKQELIWAAFLTLTKVCQEVVFAFYCQNLSLKEIAQEHGFTDDYVRQRKGRCMKSFKEAALTALNKKK